MWGAASNTCAAQGGCTALVYLKVLHSCCSVGPWIARYKGRTKHFSFLAEVVTEPLTPVSDTKHSPTLRSIFKNTFRTDKMPCNGTSVSQNVQVSLSGRNQTQGTLQTAFCFWDLCSLVCFQPIHWLLTCSKLWTLLSLSSEVSLSSPSETSSSFHS